MNVCQPKCKKWKMATSTSITFIRTISPTINIIKQWWRSKMQIDLLIFGNLNCETSDKYFDDFFKLYNPSDMVKKPTCFKNLNNASCIISF